MTNQVIKRAQFKPLIQESICFLEWTSTYHLLECLSWSEEGSNSQSLVGSQVFYHLDKSPRLCEVTAWLFMQYTVMWYIFRSNLLLQRTPTALNVRLTYSTILEDTKLHSTAFLTDSCGYNLHMNIAIFAAILSKPLLI